MKSYFTILSTGRLQSGNIWIWTKYDTSKAKCHSNILFLFNENLEFILCASGLKGKSMYNQYKDYHKHDEPIIQQIGFIQLLAGLQRAEGSVIPQQLWDKYKAYFLLEVWDEGPEVHTLTACTDRFNYYDSIGCMELFMNRASLPVIALLGTHFCATTGNITEKTTRWKDGYSTWKSVHKRTGKASIEDIGRTGNAPSGYIAGLVRHSYNNANIID